MAKGAGGSSARHRSRSSSLSFRVEAGDVGARGADAPRVRLPPLLERRVLQAGGQDRLLDLAESGRPEQFGQVTLTCAGQARFVLDVGVQLMRGPPEDAEWTLTAGVIPDAGGHDAVAPGHAGHLGQARRRDPT